MELILTGSTFSGVASLRMGICNYLVHHREEKISDEEAGMGKDAPKPTTEQLSKRRQEVLDKALKVADRICRGAPVAVAAALAMTKMRSSEQDDLYNKCLTVGRADRNEGLRAFQEKRLPIYRGSDSTSNNIFNRSPSNQLTNTATSSPYLGMFETAWDSSEQYSLERDLQHVSEQEEVLSSNQEPPERNLQQILKVEKIHPIELEQPGPLKAREQSQKSGDLGFPEHQSKLQSRSNDDQALDPAEEKKTNTLEGSNVHDLFDDAFDSRKQ